MPRQCLQLCQRVGNKRFISFVREDFILFVREVKVGSWLSSFHRSQRLKISSFGRQEPYPDATKLLFSSFFTNYYICCISFRLSSSFQRFSEPNDDPDTNRVAKWLAACGTFGKKLTSFSTVSAKTGYTSLDLISNLHEGSCFLSQCQRSMIFSFSLWFCCIARRRIALRYEKTQLRSCEAEEVFFMFTQQSSSNNSFKLSKCLKNVSDDLRSFCGSEDLVPKGLAYL